MDNAEYLQTLAAPTFDQTSVPPVPSSGIGGIVGHDLGNLIPKAVNSLGASAEGAFNFLQGPGRPKLDIPDAPNFMSEPDVDPTSRAQGLTHVLLGGVAPELAALFAPYLGISKLAKLGGVGRLGQVIAGNMAQGAVGGIKYGPGEALEGAVTGGALSAVGALPKFYQRVLPALTVGAGEAYLHPEQATTAFATSALGGLLPSLPKEIPDTIPKPALTPNPESLSLSGLRFAGDNVPATELLGPWQHEAIDTSNLQLANGSTSSEQFNNFVNTNAFPTEQLGPTHGLSLAPEPSLPSGQIINDAELPVVGTPRVSMDEFAQQVSGSVRRPLPINYEDWNLPEVQFGDRSMNPAAKMIAPSESAAGGFTSPEVISSIAGGIAGGVIGDQTTSGDPMGIAAGALLGAGAGAALGGAISSPNIRSKMLQNKQEIQSAAKAIQPSVGLNEAIQTGLKDLTQSDTYGQGGSISKLLNFADKQLGVTRSKEEKAVYTQAHGRVDYLEKRSMDYIKPYLLDPDVINPITEKKITSYLDGASNTANEQAFLKANGGIDDVVYNSLAPKDKEGYTSWSVSDDSSSDQVGFNRAFTYHVPVNKLDNLKNQWNGKRATDLINSVPAEEKPLVQAMITGRENFNEIQRIIGNALPEGSTKQLVQQSVGTYMPRLFKAFMESKYKITDEMINDTIKEFGLNKKGGIFQSAVTSGQAYDASLFQDLMQKAPQGSSQYQRLSNFVPVNLDGRTIHTTPQISELLNAAENPTHLTNVIRQHLQEMIAGRSISSGKTANRGLDPTMFEARQDLTPAYRKLLGEYTNPAERLAMAFARVHAPAQAASLMDLAKDITLPTGLKSAYEPAAWVSELQMAAKNGDTAKIQNLQQMKLLGKSAVFGEYAGNYVTRHLADHFEGGSQIWNSGIGSSISKFNTFFKTGHVPLNPLSHIRQIVSMPAFLAIGKASITGTRRAYQALVTGVKDETSAAALDRNELLQMGILTSDMIKGELKEDLNTFVSGKYDSDVSKLVKGGVNKVLEAYRKPDMLVRGATYLSAKERALEQGASEASARQQALEWTDRYTMNYDNIAPAVRFLRNVPGVSPFISYQAEMTRLIKNMVVDGVKGNPERFGTLATITAIPLGISAVAEQSLSPSDRKEWQRTVSLIPDYNQGKILVPIGKNPNGSFKYWDISPDIAHSDLIKLVKNAATGHLDVAASQNPFVSTTASPILQALAKITTQRDVRTGQEYGSVGETALSAISDILPPITPGVGYEWNRLANVNVENLYTGKKESWGDWATRIATGVSPASVKSNVLLTSLKKEFDRQAANARSEYLRVAKLQGQGLESRKTAAYESYRSTMASALQDFQQRLRQASAGS